MICKRSYVARIGIATSPVEFVLGSSFMVWLSVYLLFSFI